MNGNDYNDRLAECVRLYSNILDEKSLRSTMDILALYILVWEAFKKMVIELPKMFFCDNPFLSEDGKVMHPESEEYKEEVRSKSNDRLLASLQWFLGLHAVSEADIEKVLKIRKRRNEFVHEMDQILFNGLKDEDVSLFTCLTEIYFRLDRWWIKNVEWGINPPDIPEGEEVGEPFSMAAVAIDIMINVALGNGEKYKNFRDAIEEIRNMTGMKKRKPSED